MGTLIGQVLSIDQLHGTGYVLGPGKLASLIEDKPDDNAELSSDTQPPTPKRITVAFDDRLDLQFYLKEKGDGDTHASSSPTSDSKIKSVKSATFTGNVAVDYTELDMTSDRLILELPPEQDAPDTADSAEDKKQIAITSLQAQGNVNVVVKDQDVNLTADRLFADPAKDQLELFGTPDTAARVIRPDATLAGEHIVMDELARTVKVVGPGWFEIIEDLSHPDNTVRVTWVTSMEYDDEAGTAHFVGGVKTLSVDGTDTNELMGDDLTMVFVKDDAPSADDTQTDSTTDAPAPGTPDSSDDRTAGRRLASATMAGHVRFRARSYDTPTHQKMLTELFMMGPVMTFNDPGTADARADSNGENQMIKVVGIGRMLLTDTRPKDTAAANVKPGDKKGSIDIAGRGKTAFEWSDGLTLDLTQGVMTMKGAVAMVHQPVDGERVQLDCLDLAAELKSPAKSSGAAASKSAGAGSGLLSKDAPKPELERVWADGGIRILHGPTTIQCDHLLYEESKREIILWSDDPRQVTYEIQGEPNLTKSSAFKWHRDTGRVEVFKIRTGTIPLRRSERE
jgi:lipopolysaccharide export system protein LptA